MEFPKSPNWRPIRATDPSVWRGANVAIENAYREFKGTQQSYLVGSDFERDPYVRLPRGASNKKFGDALLDDLRGISRPRQPDIVDFADRTFFEIKPLASFVRHPLLVKEQLNSLYRVTEAIRSAIAPTSEMTWQPDNVLWLPPVLLRMPENREQIIVTAVSGIVYNTVIRGLIVYQVWELSKKPKAAKIVSAVDTVSQDKNFSKFIPEKAVIAQQIGTYEEGEEDYVILAPQILCEYVMLELDKKFDRMLGSSVPPYFDRKQPLAQFRDVARLGPAARYTKEIVDIAEITAIALGVLGGFIIVGASIILAPELLPEEGVAIEGAAGAAARAGGAEVIQLAARRLAIQAAQAAGAAAKEAIKQAPKIAAGILLVIGSVSKADSTGITFSRVSYMRVVPESQIAPYRGSLTGLSSGMSLADPSNEMPSRDEEIALDDKVMYDSEPYIVVAKLKVR